MSGAIDNVLDSYTSIDEELFDELEEALVMGDVGVTTASEITKRLNERVRKKGLKNPADVKTEIKKNLALKIAEKNATKGGTVLNETQMRSIINRLSKCDNQVYTIQGKKISIVINSNEIENKFL